MRTQSTDVSVPDALEDVQTVWQTLLQGGRAMNISSRCEYACRAVIELASCETPDEPLTAVQIAESRHIPEKYLVHIMLQLKRAGLVRSIRGAQGGYHLGRPAAEISLLDIVEAIDGPIMEPLPIDDEAARYLAPVWRHTAKNISGLLKEIAITDIIEDANKSNMYYI